MIKDSDRVWYFIVDSDSVRYLIEDSGSVWYFIVDFDTV
jgi:(2Fe-2S) ferredoxin